MAKKKKKSLIWRATKATFRGIGNGIKKTYSYARDKHQKTIIQKSLDQSPVYNSLPEYSQFGIIKEIQGSFKDTEKRLHENSVVALIFGKRGSGKTALGFKMLENIRKKQQKRTCYVLGIPQEVMPKWIKSIDSLDGVKGEGVILVDEGAISFGARESMASKNKELSKILAIARHRNLSVIFITQNTGLIDRNILALADTMLIKQGSLLQEEMERPEIKKFYEKSRKNLSKLEGDKRKYVYVFDSDFEGVVSHDLPSFWNEKISKNRDK